MPNCRISPVKRAPVELTQVEIPQAGFGRQFVEIGELSLDGIRERLGCRHFVTFQRKSAVLRIFDADDNAFRLL